mmetsp:Transcript_122288/g.228449  ORF Transcript_122288/g.228449 Transcript_122288/m.228449 type:complete len:576 (+) Transcript_122288:134-1861(+)
MKRCTSPSRISLLITWLCFETAFDAWMGLCFIPRFYGVKVFQQTSQFSITKCSAVIQANQKNVSSQIDAARECVDVQGSKLSDTVNYQLFHEDGRSFSNILNGVVLLICGLLAPSCEMGMRVIHNLFFLCNIKQWLPRLVQCWERYVYFAFKDVLRHLSQFKLFLCFLQMLLSIKLFGLDLVKIEAGPGLEDFVKFVLWSIFLNSVVKKVEIPIKQGEPLFPAILPKKDWTDTVLAPKKMHTKTMISIVQLVGFYLWLTLPVFTMVFKFAPQSPDAQGVTEVKYYTESFMPIQQGFSKLHGNLLMWCLLCFQLLWCNLAAAVFQLVSAIIQEWSEWMPAWKRVRASEPFSEELIYKALEAEPSISRKVISLLLGALVENQAHEYFLCAFAMLMYVMISMLESGLLADAQKGSPCGNSGFELQMCFNPLICLWLLFSVLLLGQARAKLYAKSIGQEFRILTFQLLMALCLSYYMVFHDVQIWKYFGNWTLQKEYVIDYESRMPFNCFSHGSPEQQCFIMSGQELSPFSSEVASLSLQPDMHKSMSGLLNATLHCLDLLAIVQQPRVTASSLSMLGV